MQKYAKKNPYQKKHAKKLRITRKQWTRIICLGIVLALVVYVLYMGVVMNVILAIFNLIPIPPFDGSRIFYAFLPPRWYFGVMKYERYIMLGCIILFFLMSNMGINPLARFENWVINGLFTVTGMGGGTLELGLFGALLDYLDNLVALR